MRLDRSVHSDETADGVTLPVALGVRRAHDGLAQMSPPPPIFGLG